MNMKNSLLRKRSRHNRVHTVLFRVYQFLEKANLIYNGFPRWFIGEESACQAGDMDLILGSERSPGEENGNPLQYSYWRTPGTEEPGGLQFMGLQEELDMTY